MGDLVRGLDADGGYEGFDLVLPLRRSGKLPPLFCFPPLNGLGWSYAGLLRHIHPGQPLYCLQLPEVSKACGFPQTYEAAAMEFIRHILGIQAEGPYHLLGWSFGGILAHITACRFQMEGRAVASLTLLDAYPRTPDTPMSADGVKPEPEPEPDSELSKIRFERLRYYSSHFADARFSPQTFSGDMLLFTTPETAGACHLWYPFVSGRVISHLIPHRHDVLTQPGPIDQIGEIFRKHFFNENFQGIVT